MSSEENYTSSSDSKNSSSSSVSSSASKNKSKFGPKRKNRPSNFSSVPAYNI